MPFDLTRVRALLLDVDGTLVDSDYLHVIAWQRAVRDAGFDVPAAVVHAAIGLDAAKLTDATAPDADDADQQRILDAHTRHYEALVPELRRLPGARELLRAAHARGIRTVLATSAPRHEVEQLLRVLDADDVIDAITSADDVGAAKPAPDVFEAAAAQAGVPKDGCLVVGDARWDMIAAGTAGITAVGVESGGVDARELVDTGAAAVFRDTADLLAAFTDAWERDQRDEARATTAQSGSPEASAGVHSDISGSSNPPARSR